MDHFTDTNGNNGPAGPPGMFDPWAQRGHHQKDYGYVEGGDMQRQLDWERERYPGDTHKYGSGTNNVMISGFGEQNFFG